MERAMAIRYLSTAWLAAVVISVCAHPTINSSPFSYDRQLALDLGSAYAHSLAKEMPAKPAGKLDFSTPRVLARIFKDGRHLVQISYGSNQKDVGVFVVLELCPENGLLTIVDSAYYEGTSPAEQFAQSGAATYYAAPAVCSKSRDAP